MMMELVSPIVHRVRTFRNIVVHPTQELRGAANTFRGGPDWPHFQRQILARHCRGAFPRPVDYRPHPAEPEFPYFDSDRYLDPRYKPDRRWSAFPTHNEFKPSATAGSLGRRGRVRVLVRAGNRPFRAYGRRVLHAAGPLQPPGTGGAARLQHRAAGRAEPPDFFWQIIDHLGIDRARVMLVRRPTRFGRLLVVPQAERPYGGPANPRHLDLMDRIPGWLPAERGDDCVFISRSRQPKGNFAGEAYPERTVCRRRKYGFPS